MLEEQVKISHENQSLQVFFNQNQLLFPYITKLWSSVIKKF